MIREANETLEKVSSSLMVLLDSKLTGKLLFSQAN